ncbi:AAA family ATPase [Curtobacterium sp. MCBD17_028]|uniref:AAA family ATPase n=1 Tax=Curtobacterium sp. MCBD17_028 TaxID=2175670 RepID=UPI00281548A8|nr:AAA family ATPase [Curtobacterium sp. MCBD17_028]
MFWVLIVLRGNSGSGKSTVAQLLQAKLAGPAAVLHQDYFYRVIFREQGTAGMAHADLLESAAAHCLGAGQHVVMDGIFNARQYEDVLARIAGRADDARFYAFDLTFEETVQRHASRPKALEFGVEEMRGWYHGWQPLSFVRERPIGGDESADQIAERILSDGPNEL